MEEILDEYGEAIVVLIGVISGISIIAACIDTYKDSITCVLYSIMYR